MKLNQKAVSYTENEISQKKELFILTRFLKLVISNFYYRVLSRF